MKKTIKAQRTRLRIIPSCLLLLGAGSLLLLVFAPSVYAAECGGTETFILNCDKPGAMDNNGVWSILLIAINILTAGVGVIAVGAIVYAAFLYTSASDDDSQISKAKDSITNTIIGVVGFALMYSLLQFIIPGGIFGNGSPMLATSIKSPIDSLPISEEDFPIPKSSGSSSSGGGSTTTTPTGKLTHVENFRDAAASSNVMQAGILYRSANLHEANAQDVKTLSSLLGGGTIIDVRMNSGRNKSPDKNIPGTRKLNVPITGTLNYTIFVTKASDRQAFGRVISTIANTNGKVLIHCAEGKDRTGWAVAMVMYALGANDQQVMNEYMKSAPSGAVKRAWLNAGISKARAQYGSINGYLKNGLGLSNATLTKLRNKLRA